MKTVFKQQAILNKGISVYMVYLFVMTVMSCAPKSTLELAIDGTSDYEIIFIGEVTRSQYESAEILQNYIHKISQVKLPIVDESSQNLNRKKIYIGNVNGDDLEKDQINIKAENNNLFINGGSDESIRDAVYEFLETYLNCKWFAPDAEKIPSTKIITIAKNIDYTYTPEITTRTVHSRLFYEHPDFAQKLKVTTEAFPYYIPTARVHTFNKFAPEEKYYKSHPEYFALRDNKRLPTQLCLTNEAVYNIVRDSVASLFKQFPDAQVVSVSQNDNQQYCTCDNCRKIDEAEGGPSGTIIQFVNRIAADFPNKTISTLAYQYTRKPSKTKPLDNVLITLCSIECDRSAPIEENCVDFANDLRGWRAITNNIRIWDYTTQFTNFLAPFPNLQTLQPNIKFFRDNHAQWVFEQHSNNPSELFELRSYVMAKLLWNPDSDLDVLISEFTNGYYQEAGIYIKKYIDLIHEKLQEDQDFFLFLYGDPSQAFSSYLKPELLSAYSDFFDQAEKAVSGKPEVLERVKQARLGVDYAVLEACRKNISETYNLSKNNTAETLLEKLKNTCEQANITLMNEMGFTVKEYCDAYLKAIDVAKQPNKAFSRKVILLTNPKKYANEDPQTLTDGALGGSSFYSNWLGFEGNDMESIVDLGEPMDMSTLSTAFLQVTNHIVFFPTQVSFYSSNDAKNYKILGTVINEKPLIRESKINDIQYFQLKTNPIKARYIKVKAINLKKAPYWHHAAGLPSWIFADEIIIN